MNSTIKTATRFVKGLNKTNECRDKDRMAYIILKKDQDICQRKFGEENK
jgi:hypothetical protein